MLYQKTSKLCVLHTNQSVAFILGATRRMKDACVHMKHRMMVLIYTAGHVVFSNYTKIKHLDFSRICNLLAEYGSKIRQDYASEAYYKEHYEVLIEGHALQSLAKL